MTHTSNTDIRHAGILGLGVSGKGLLSYLQAQGVKQVTLRSHDTSAARIRLPADAFDAVRLMTGAQVYDDICEDVLFLSPSVRRDAPPLLAAQARGVRLSSDAELFFENVSGTVFAITGSDGKSTTAKISELLLKTGQYSSVSLAGNIGYPLSPLLLKDGDACAYAVELSSFQLMYTAPKSHRALITNISENHLNWHRGMEEYIRAKMHIAEHTEAFVLNADDEILASFKGRKPYAVYSMKHDARTLGTFGASVILTLSGDAIAVNGEARLPLSDIALPGKHSVQNYMAAMALCEGSYDKTALRDVAASFRGLPHRACCVKVADGVRFVDSSIDSSPLRTLTTLRALACRPILILCGRSKGQSFTELAQNIPLLTRGVVCAGEFGEKVYSALCRTCAGRIPVLLTDTMAEGVACAARIARAGDTVLLSPGATSFDEYQNFEDRAADFRRIIDDLYDVSQKKGCFNP